MYCSKCGAEIQPGAKFCPKCGTPTPQADEQAAAPTAEPSAPAPAPASPSPAGQAPAPAPAQSKRAIPLIAIIIACAVVAVGVGVWVWFAFLSPIPIDEATFPDVAVRNVVSQQLDADGNGELSRDEANSATQFSVDGAANLDGLSHFPNLRSLWVSGTALSSADLKPFGALESFVTEAPLAELDVSGNPHLTELGVADTTVVTGLEATQLEETWLPMAFTFQNGREGETYDSYEGNSVTRTADGMPKTYTYVWYSRGTGEKSADTTTYEFNDAGQVVSSSSHSSYASTGDDANLTRTYAYDDAGRLISYTNDSEYNNSTTTYTYDADGQLVTVGTEDPDSSYQSGDTRIAYDDAGRPTSVSYEQDGTTMTTYEIYSYDDAGRLSVCSNIQPRSYYYTVHTLSYDEEGRVVQSVVTPGDSIYDNSPAVSDYKLTVDYALDENGRVTSGQSTSDYGSDTPTTVTKTTCEYDEHGNLVKTDTYNVPSDGSSNVYHTIYELSYARFFTKKGAEKPPQVLYLAPSYDSQIFGEFTQEPYLLSVPALPEAYVPFIESATQETRY